MGNNQCHYSNNCHPQHVGDDGPQHRNKRNTGFGVETALERFIGRKANRQEARAHKRSRNQNYQVVEASRPEPGYLIAVIPQNSPQVRPPLNSQPHPQPQLQSYPHPHPHPHPQHQQYHKQQSNPTIHSRPQPRFQPSQPPKYGQNRGQSNLGNLYGDNVTRGNIYGENTKRSNIGNLYGDTDDGGDNITAVCKFCSDNIIPEYYSDHMKYCRLNPKNVTTRCDYCGEEFDLKMIDNHKKNCDSKPENIKFKCEYCDERISLVSHYYHLSRCLKNPHNVIDTKPTKRPDESQINQVPECAICLLEMKDPKKIKFLGCAHKFHQECIDDWAQKSKTCPVCVTEFE